MAIINGVLFGEETVMRFKRASTILGGNYGL